MHIRNIHKYVQAEPGDKIYFDGEGSRTIAIEVIPLGPCAVRWNRVVGKKSVAQLVAVVDRHETVKVDVQGEGFVTLEPSAEAWYHAQRITVTKLAEDGASLTRLEKPGLYIDELSIALHRQAVLQRIQAGQLEDVRTAYTTQLERRLEEMALKIDALTPKQEPPPEVQNAQ